MKQPKFCTQCRGLMVQVKDWRGKLYLNCSNNPMKKVGDNGISLSVLDHDVLNSYYDSETGKIIFTERESSWEPVRIEEPTSKGGGGASVMDGGF